MEEHIHLLLNRVVVYTGLGEFTHEVVHSRNDVCHLGARDAPVPIDVVQIERPPYLLVQRASGEDGETLHEILESRSEASV